MPDTSAPLNPGARAIVNANYDVDNVVKIEQAEPRIQKTLQTCSEILKHHCGPSAGYAMLVADEKSELNEPALFTKDGIRILSSVEFMSPLERFVKDLLTYIGERVDSAAKDGTTTSMLFSSLFLSKLLAHRGELKSYGLSSYTTNKVVTKLFSSIRTELESYIFSVAKLAEAENFDLVPETTAMKLAGKIAFMQALSSSGGNVDIAQAMREVFEASPKVSWNFIASRRSPKETPQAFSVERDQFDGRIRCVGASISMNAALGTEYVADDVEFMIALDPLDQMSAKTDDVIGYLKKVPEDKNFLLLSQRFDSGIMVLVNQLNISRKVPISLWQYSATQMLAGQAYPWELQVLAAVSGIEPITSAPNQKITELNIGHAKHVRWHDTYLDFTGMVEPEPGSCLHPYYLHPESAPKYYNELRSQLEQQINLYRGGHKNNGVMLNTFVEVMNSLACLHRPTIRLGGTTHEQMANNDVIVDVQGATMSSLTDGFLVNSTLSLSFALWKLRVKLTEAQKTAAKEHFSALEIKSLQFQVRILNDMIDALREVTQVIYAKPGVLGSRDPKFVNKNFNEMLEDPDLYLNAMSSSNTPQSVSRFLNLLDQPLDLTDVHIAELVETNYPVTQPVKITYELLKRIQELLLKFVGTDKIIVFGGVVVDESQQGKK